MKNATIVLGSPNAKGNTARLVDAVLSAVDNESISIRKIELSKLKRINHCTGCDSCKKNDMRKCVFDDGLNDVIAEVRNSDLLIIASPIYFFNFNSLTKAFIDRLFYSSEINNNENLLLGKKVAILMTYGLTNVIDSGAKNALQSFYDISKFVGLEIVGIVYGSFGDNQEQNQLLLNKAKNLGKTINKEIGPNIVLAGR
jgi:multimeric flavodoxin WrbA